MNKIRGLVSRIIPFSAVDGPGSRLVVFLQGCNMRCTSCHNPHTMGLCTLCGLCVRGCPNTALSFNENQTAIQYNESLCKGCDHCISNCPVNSNPKSRLMDVDELLARIRPVSHFLSGVTISGGEATQQSEFVKEVFTRIKRDPQLANLTNYIDSNGLASIIQWEELLPVIEGAMIDLKALDDEVHHKLTGVSNQQVLSTISYLYQQRKLYEVRLLIVPGYNDSLTQINEIADYFAGISNKMRIRLIPFRSHGVKGKLSQTPNLPMEQLEKIKAVFLARKFMSIYIT